MEIKTDIFDEIIKNIKEIISEKIKCNYLHKYDSLNDDSNRLFRPMISCNLNDHIVDIYMDIKCYNDKLKKEKNPILLNLDYFDRVGTEYQIYGVYFMSISYLSYMQIIFEEKGRLIDTLIEVIENTKTKKIDLSDLNNYCIERHWNLSLTNY